MHACHLKGVLETAEHAAAMIRSDIVPMVVWVTMRPRCRVEDPWREESLSYSTGSDLCLEGTQCWTGVLPYSRHARSVKSVYSWIAFCVKRRVGSL
jgi:hypothetical protein